MKSPPPIPSCSNENFYFHVGDYSFGFNGKDKESEFNSGAYDFGARIHDARLGRWMSVDRFVKQYASQTPYAYSNDNPILFIDIDGEKGTIYIQVMLDAKGKPVIDRSTLKAVKKELERRYAELGVDLKIEVQYSNKFMTKTEFYSRKGADKTDSYVVIGTPDQIVSFDRQAISKLGWGKSMIEEKVHRVNGSTPENGDQISLLNANNLKQIGENEKFSSVIMKIARNIEHETMHPKIMDHPGLNNEAGPVPAGSGGHVYNTVMDENMNSDNCLYDRYMVEKLRNTHGTTSGANNMLLEEFKELSYSNYSKQHPKMNMEDVKKEVNSMTTWILETRTNSKPK